GRLENLRQRRQEPVEGGRVIITEASEIPTGPIDTRVGSVDGYDELKAFFDRRDVKGKRLRRSKGQPRPLGRKHYDPQEHRWVVGTRAVVGGLSVASMGILATTWEAGVGLFKLGLSIFGF